MTEKELLQAIYDDMKETKNKIANMESKIENIESRTENMESNMESMKSDITSIKLTIENEIRVNIQRVAEGHLDLSRNLHEAMKPSNEVEMLAIKVNFLESEIRELKRKIV